MLQFFKRNGLILYLWVRNYLLYVLSHLYYTVDEQVEYNVQHKEHQNTSCYSDMFIEDAHTNTSIQLMTDRNEIK